MKITHPASFFFYVFTNSIATKTPAATKLMLTPMIEPALHKSSSQQWISHFVDPA